MSVRENINLGVIARDAGRRRAQPRAGPKARAPGAIKALGIRVAERRRHRRRAVGRQPAEGAAVAPARDRSRKVLILDEPTRGVDIGAKSEIYRIIDELARKGIGVIVISSELPEIIGICDRVLVMREGTSTARSAARARAPITQENIMALATGIAAVERDETARREATNEPPAPTPPAGGTRRFRASGARQRQIMSLIQALGMLPVLILLVQSGFHCLRRRPVHHAAEPRRSSRSRPRSTPCSPPA